VDGLAALARLVRDAVPAEWAEELAVERERPTDVRDHEVDVVDPGRAHAASLAS
jgi:hypothetical protein